MDATIKCEKGLGPEAILVVTGNAKGHGKSKHSDRNSGQGDKSDEDQDHKGKVTCFYCHQEGQKVWN